MKTVIIPTILLLLGTSCGYMGDPALMTIESVQVRKDITKKESEEKKDDQEKMPGEIKPAGRDTLAIETYQVEDITLVNDVFENALNIKSGENSTHHTFFIEQEEHQGQARADTFVIDYPEDDSLKLTTMSEHSDAVVCYHTMNQFNNSSVGCIPQQELQVFIEHSVRKIELEFKGNGFYEILTLATDSQIGDETSRRVSILPFAYGNLSSMDLLSEQHMAGAINTGENPFVKEIKTNSLSAEPIISAKAAEKVRFNKEQTVDIEETIREFSGPEIPLPESATDEPETAKIPEVIKEPELVTEPEIVKIPEALPSLVPELPASGSPAPEPPVKDNGLQEAVSPFAGCQEHDFACHHQIVMEMCAQHQSQTRTWTITLPTSSQCDFNADGNNKKSGKAAARVHHQTLLSLPSDAVVCNIDKFETDHKLLFDDEMFIMANNIILTASLSYYLDFMPVNDVSLSKFSWESIYNVTEDESAPSFCLGTGCTIPSEANFGTFSLDSVGNSISQQIFSEGLIIGLGNSVLFSSVALGDDNSADCRLQQKDSEDSLMKELEFEVTLTYVTGP